MQFYKHIGVLRFKKAVLLLEKYLHLKNGSILKNYHPENLTHSGIRDFSWYLLYNCILHIMSILLSILYFFISYVGNIVIWPIHLAVIVLVFANLYCIFLQRYTFLKLRNLQLDMSQMLNRQYAKCLESIEKAEYIVVHKEEFLHTLKFIDDLEKFFNNKGSLYISEDYAGSLKQIKMVINSLNIKLPYLKKINNMYDLSIDGGIKQMDPDKRVDVIVSKLKSFGNQESYRQVSSNNVLVLRTSNCRELYQEVFGDASTDVQLIRIKLLKYIYLNKVRTE